MKNVIKLMLIFTLFISSAYAEDSGYGTIDEMRVFSGTILIFMSGDTNVCGNPYAYKIPRDEDQMYSLSLLAYASGKEVNVQYFCDANADAIITGVRVR